tara:strand:- start:811 stop:2076 length:1266 start_codon:yes stop_codon:yes gene_type:complete
MKIAIIGSGGREHAICQKINESKKVKKIFCIPGNGGTKKIAENIKINLKNFKEIKSFLLRENIDLTIIGPEEPLVNGIVNFLRKYKLKVFGPDRYCSRLEGSKIFTKKICKKENIPTANFKIFKDIKSSIKYVRNTNYPLVVKADGLAAGKGVFICRSFNDAKRAISKIFNGSFGRSKEILIENFLHGEEMSFFIIYDNKTFKFFNTAQDHKRAFEGDNGPNTGGMGAYSPSRLHNKTLEKKIIDRIILPTLNYLKKRKAVYVGFLYAGLMIKENDPYLIEYNVRMGDPECQTILPLLKNDFLEIIENCTKGKLNKTKIKWKNKKSVCVVLTSKGYPNKYKKNIVIKNLKMIKNKNNQYIFHAGTKLVDGKFYSYGGRVLNFVSTHKNFISARKNSLKLIKILNWRNGFYRSDIGFKVIDR